MKKDDFKVISFNDNKLDFINQTKLPLEEEVISTDDYNRIAEGIEKLEIRGAPAIGVAAAYGLAIAVNKHGIDVFNEAFERLWKTRPTAVNLFRALNDMKEVYQYNKNNKSVIQLLIDKAI